MAKHNETFLYGMVLSPAKFQKNAEGKNIRGCVPLLVIRGQRDICNNKLTNVKYDAPIILTEDEDFMELMTTMKVNNMVEVKGVYTTKDIQKATLCSGCKEKIHKQGTMSYISPIYMDIRETGIDEMKAKELLEKRNEISNSITTIGTLTADPEFYHEGKVSTLQYPIAVNRKYYIKESNTTSKTDYPMIKTFGKRAEEDSQRLKKGARVLINGMLQTKDFKNKIQCEHCGTITEFKDTAMEIVTYSVEYLKDYITSEELAEAQAEAAAEATKALFDE